MFNFDLFLGFHVDVFYEEYLSTLHSSRRALFIDNGDDYLSDIEYCGLRYLGKRLGSDISTAALDDISKNITSISVALSGENNSLLKLQLFAIPS